MTTPVHDRALRDALRDALHHSGPALRHVLAREILATGLALRAEMLTVLVVLIVMTVVGLAVDGRTGFELLPMTLPIVVLAAVIPAGVWRGASPARRSYFWALPVRRDVHTLARVFGGWLWIMAVLGACVLWIVASNGAAHEPTNVGFDYAQAMLRGALQPGDRVRDIDLSRAAWFWLVPFGAATVSYLLGSVVFVRSDHPWRWFAGTLVGGVVLNQLARALGARAVAQAVDALVVGSHGLVTLVTGFPKNPAAGAADWLRTVALWAVPSIVLIVLAARRRHER